MLKRNQLFDWRLWKQLLLRRWYFMFLSCFLAISLGLFIALKTPPEFESWSRVMIIDTDLISNSNLRFVPGLPRQGLDYFRQLITSSKFLMKLKDSLDIANNEKIAKEIAILAHEHPDIDLQEIRNQVMIKYLQKKISYRVKNFNLIELRARGRTSEEAYLLCRAMTNLAIEESKKEQLQSVSEASSISHQLLEIYKKRLAEAENNLEKLNYSLQTQSIEDRKLSRAKVNEIQSVILTTRVELENKQKEQKELEAYLTDYPPELRERIDQAISQKRATLMQRSKEVCYLLKKFDWRDAEVMNVNEEIGRLKREILQTISDALLATKLPPATSNRILKYETLRIESVLLKKTLDTFEAIIQDHLDALKNEPSREILRDRLKKEVQVNREIYQLLLQQVRGTHIRETALSRESKLRYKVISPPLRPLERVKPHRKKIMAIALFLGMSLGLGLVMGLEKIDTSFKTVDDVVEELDLPVLAAIPRLSVKHRSG